MKTARKLPNARITLIKEVYAIALEGMSNENERAYVNGSWANVNNKNKTTIASRLSTNCSIPSLIGFNRNTGVDVLK